MLHLAALLEHLNLVLISCRFVTLHQLKALMHASMQGTDLPVSDEVLPWLTGPDDEPVDQEGFLQAIKVRDLKGDIKKDSAGRP